MLRRPPERRQCRPPFLLATPPSLPFSPELPSPQMPRHRLSLVQPASICPLDNLQTAHTPTAARAAPHQNPISLESGPVLQMSLPTSGHPRTKRAPTSFAFVASALRSPA